MASLKKNGVELLRVSQEKELPDDTSISWFRYTRTYHSNGKILQKYDVRFRASGFHTSDENYSYGWKLWGKLKPGSIPEQYVAQKVALIQSGKSKWTIVTGGRPAVIISTERIMRACESGESIGFCKECGHSQDGYEPDARGYKCESCGAMEVYGAEEMLISV